MITDEMVAAFKRGECPGCGGSIALVAEGGQWHYIPGAVVERHGPTEGGKVAMIGGEPLVSRGAHLAPGDPRVCEWTTDRLYSVQLVAGWRDGRSMLDA